MTLFSEDMTIVARLKQDQRGPRERAEEERRTRKQTRGYKRRLITLRRLRHARRVRNQLKASKRRGGPSFSKRVSAAKSTLKGAAVKGASMAAKGVSVVGWALLVADFIVIGHEVGRRFEGKSGRLVEAEDAHVVMGDLDEKAQANADALGFVENDADLLRVTGQDKKMSGTLMGTVGTIKKLALERAMGADMIRRDPHFDSKDSFVDKMMDAISEKEIQGMADRTAHLIRTERGIGKGI